MGKRNGAKSKSNRKMVRIANKRNYNKRKCDENSERIMRVKPEGDDMVRVLSTKVLERKLRSAENFH